MVFLQTGQVFVIGGVEGIFGWELGCGVLGTSCFELIC